MATISTTATFAATFEKFDVPMRPDNTPWYPIEPIGRLLWEGSVVVPALISSNISELAVTCEVPPNYALRFTAVDWTALVTNTGTASEADIMDIEDFALLTFTGNSKNRQVILQKPENASRAVITNAFTVANFVPLGGQNTNRLYLDDFSTSGIIFRSVNQSTNDTNAVTYSTSMEALVYTIEQSRQGFIYSILPHGISGGSAST